MKATEINSVLRLSKLNLNGKERLFIRRLMKNRIDYRLTKKERRTLRDEAEKYGIDNTIFQFQRHVINKYKQETDNGD